MSDINTLVKFAVDSYKNRLDGKFSKEDTKETLKNALIELNGGKTSINRKIMRDGAHTGLFTLIEEIIQKTVVEGLQGDEFFNEFVEYRNLALGDKNEFVVEDDSLFIVAEMARGTGRLRRQRLGERQTFTVPTTTKGVRIYEELDRIMSGRSDLNAFIDKVGRSVRENTLNELYMAFDGLDLTVLGSTYYKTGAFSEDVLLDMIEHIEAKTGQLAKIIGTRKGLRKITSSPDFAPETAKEDMYNMGYLGRFIGTPTIKIPQRHKVGTDTFVFDDNQIYVVAGENKFIKHITEGDNMIDMRTDLANIADFTQEYMYIETTGTGIVLNNAAIGKYVLS